MIRIVGFIVNHSKSPPDAGCQVLYEIEKAGMRACSFGIPRRASVCNDDSRSSTAGTVDEFKTLGLLLGE